MLFDFQFETHLPLLYEIDLAPGYFQVRHAYASPGSGSGIVNFGAMALRPEELFRLQPWGFSSSSPGHFEGPGSNVGLDLYYWSVGGVLLGWGLIG